VKYPGYTAGHGPTADQNDLTMGTRRVVTQLLLLFALLAGQHLALVHAVSHLPNGEVGGRKEGGLLHGKVCSLCVLSSHLAHAVTSAAPVLATAPSALLEALPLRGSHFAALVLGFHSRAPPAAL
jgi:hypothetical protein